MQLRSGLLGIITILAAIGGVVTGNFPVSFSALPVMAQTITEQKAEADRFLQQGIEQYRASQFQAAIQSWQKALAIYRGIDDLRGEGKSLNNLGSAYTYLGQYQRAIEFHQQSLEIDREMSNRSGVAKSLNNLGNSYDHLGEYQKAIDFYQQSWEIAREIGERSVQAKSLNNLGNVYNFLGQYQKAIEFHQQSLEINREMSNRSGVASSLNNLGNVYNYLGEYQKAIEFHQQSLEIKKEIGNRRGEAKSLKSLGLAYHYLGQYQKAMEFYQQSLAIAQEIGDRPGERSTLSNIGFLLEKQNQLELATIFFKQSVNVTETIRQDIQGLPSELQESFLETCECTYRALADLLLKQDRILEAQRVLDLLKVQELEDYLRNVRGNGTTAQGVPNLPPEQQIEDGYEAILDKAIEIGKELTQLRKQENLTPTQEQRLAQLVKAQETIIDDFNNFIESPEVEALIAQLTPKTRKPDLVDDLEDLIGLPTNLDELQQNAVLLYPLILEDRLELILTTPNSPPIRRTVSVTKEQLNQAIFDFRQALRDSTSNAEKPAQQLYDWLIKPLENELTNAEAQTIIYAPDGQLRYIPLAALHDGEQWLVQRYRINNITARSLTDLNSQPQAQIKVLAAALVDKNYSFTLAGEPFDFKGLPNAGVEVDILAETFSNTTKLLDDAFNPQDTIPKMGSHTVVHFATHGAIVVGEPEESFILFGNGTPVTLKDIEKWNLNGIDLVVLSACETGINGNLGTGAEILGLGYQIERAGARAAIASLWQVDDGATQMLMNAFYNVLQTDNITKAEALRQAQIALINDDYSV
ncbi:MAG: CHAT domain-containing protein, partial [Coleofasciculaceae cyanobacterium]